MTDLKTLLPLEPVSLETCFWGACLFIVLVIVSKIMKAPPKPASNKYELSRERIRQLIRGQVKPRSYETAYAYETDTKELEFSMMHARYHMGKAFGMASSSPSNSLNIGQGMTIAPHSREHGAESGRRAAELRRWVIEKYGIDLETLEDAPEEYLNHLPPKS